jgi:hypothetical protein
VSEDSQHVQEHAIPMVALQFDHTRAEMSRFVVHGIPTEHADALRHGGADANGQPAIARVSRGLGNPCRHCLRLIADGDDKLVLAYRPFADLQPYAEVGPIFLHREPCLRYQSGQLPSWFAHLQPALVRGYGHDDWIRYETAQVIEGSQLSAACQSILSGDDVAYVHIRSKFNCFQCRVDRG